MAIHGVDMAWEHSRCCQCWPLVMKTLFLHSLFPLSPSHHDLHPPYDLNPAPPADPPAFRNPLISFVYERGWRQGFSWAGEGRGDLGPV